MSRVRQRFLDQLPKWISNVSKIDMAWTSSLQALEGHSDWVNTVVFSPDSSLLASASHNNTVRLWDAATGASLEVFKHAHSHSLNLSWNGTQLIVDGKRYAIRWVFSSALPSQPMPREAHYAIDRERLWITWSNERMLWLPPNRRPGVHACREGTIVIGNGSGRMTFIHCDPTASLSCNAIDQLYDYDDVESSGSSQEQYSNLWYIAHSNIYFYSICHFLSIRFFTLIYPWCI